ncbi:MAG: hypothetical protein M1819_000190 [Sarea resinae]|nr:MAG: hypothetical protein M1819_000190 [Sarea resinae]
MPLTLAPAQESDLATLVEIQTTALADTAFSQVIHPNGMTATSRQALLERLRWSYLSDPHSWFLKVTDDDTGAVVAFAKWNVFAHPRTAEELDAEDAAEPKRAPELHADLIRNFFGQLHAWRRKLMGGDPCYYLHLLFTLPAYHRRGAGSQLIEWGTSRADAANLPAYVEATAKGYELYKRHGFEQRGWAVVDLVPYGGSDEFRNRVMVRPAKGSSNKDEDGQKVGGEVKGSG